MVEWPPEPLWDRGCVVRHWYGLLIVMLAGGGQAEAEMAKANFAVSVTVVDQCLVRSLTRSASCTGHAAYAVDVARERLALAAIGQLTRTGEHAHTSADGSPAAISMSVADGQGVGLAATAERSAAPASDQVEAIRVTYSF
jgi:hypothetical protein